MQLDTSLTFGDIHGGNDGLLASVEEIENLALVEEPERREPLRIRLLEIPNYQVNDEVFLLRLCPLTKPQREQRWISVSYCWAHLEPSGHRTIPDYRILVQSNPPKEKSTFRNPSCPVMVLHRAVCFARARNCRYIWIDQECIVQDDPTDIENHLQVMHRIYSGSMITVAVLSCKITDQSSLDALIAFLISPVDEKKLRADGARRILQYITDDRWFRRAWTYQERHCADCLEFLIPIAPGLNIVEHTWLKIVDTDLCVGNLVFWRSIGVLGAGIAFATGDTITDPTWRKYSSYFEVMGWDSKGFGKNVFEFLEACDISILSDKLAIYGNICGLNNKLKTTLLRNSRYSYSTCLLALCFASQWQIRAERQVAYKEASQGLLDMTIGEFLPLRDATGAGTGSLYIERYIP